jgi:hypothetical protein
MAQEPGKIKEHIDDERRKLEEDFEEIEHRVKNVMDWRTWYERNPGYVLGAAFAGGFLIAKYANNSNAMPAAGYQPRRRSGQLEKLGELMEDTLSAVLGVATAKIEDVVAETIPGFREHYSEARSHRVR